MSTGMSIIIMGVSGTGKSTISRAFASRIGADLLDGDDLHPHENIEKMESGVPLKDKDRDPWLRTCNREMRARNEAGRHVVLSCSSLKRRYRDILAHENNVYFVYLKISKAESLSRASQRIGHFMPASMIESQFAALEEPASDERTIVVNSGQSLENVVEDLFTTFPMEALKGAGS